MATRIHPTAVIDPAAVLEDDVEVGAHAVIEGGVTVGAGTRVHAHAVILRGTTLGPRNELFPGVVLGGPPQDRHWKGEESRVEIGADNIFRESVTVNKATGAGAVTRIGDRNFFMACSHVAHNCTVGNDVVLVNGALLAGHVTVEDRALLSGNAAVQQFARVGTLAMISGNSAISKDLPPYLVAVRRAEVLGVNVVGLRRAGIPQDRRVAVKRAFRLLYYGEMPIAECLARLEAEESAPEVKRMVEFVRASKRGILRRAARSPERDGNEAEC